MKLGALLVALVALIVAPQAIASAPPNPTMCLRGPFPRIIIGTILGRQDHDRLTTMRVSRVLVGSMQQKTLRFENLYLNDACPSLGPYRWKRGQRFVLFFRQGVDRVHPYMMLTPEFVYEHSPALAVHFPDVKQRLDEAYRRKAKPFGGAIPRGDPAEWVTVHNTRGPHSLPGPKDSCGCG